MQEYKNHKFSFIHRFLHWAIALSILFMLLTVFLRMGWMNKNNVSEIILNDLRAMNINISQQEGVKIAKDIRNPMFQWHVYIGYVLTILLVLRILYIFSKGTRNRYLLWKQSSIKKKIQSLVYIVFYIVLVITLISGLLIELGSKDYKNLAMYFHKPSLYIMLGFIFIHFTGIIIAEKSTASGVVSSMLSGRQ